MKNILKKCIVCGKEFAKTRKGRKFCSRNCYYKWQKEHPNKGWRKKGNKLGFQRGHKVFGGFKSRFDKGQTPWNKGKHIQTNNALEVWNKNGGIPWLKGTHQKTNDALLKWRKNGGVIKGKQHWNWKGGTSKLRERIEALPQYKRWRKSVFERDDYTCQKCKVKGGRLHPHHKKEFSRILKENNIRTVEQAKKCKELWKVSNGQTLCLPCHRQTKSYLKNGILKDGTA